MSDRKVILVTGGAVRIGAEICRAAAVRGFAVAVHYRSSGREADALSAELARNGGEVSPVQSTLESEADCVRLIEQARGWKGRVNALVNNASAFDKFSMGTASQPDWMRMFWPNFFMPMQLTRLVAAQGEGAVVNLLDRRIAGNDTACGPYVLSKKALAEGTRMAALEFAPRWRVNAVAPGPVLPPPGLGPDYLKDHAGQLPLERRPAVADIAGAVMNLLESTSVTGQILFVDGGQHLLGDV